MTLNKQCFSRYLLNDLLSGACVLLVFYVEILKTEFSVFISFWSFYTLLHQYFDGIHADFSNNHLC